MATTEKVQQPAWVAPVPETPEPRLKVWNSLTRTKVRCLLTRVSASQRADFAVPERVRADAWETCGLVQLWADGVRCCSYGTCEVCPPIFDP